MLSISLKNYYEATTEADKIDIWTHGEVIPAIDERVEVDDEAFVVKSIKHKLGLHHRVVLGVVRVPKPVNRNLMDSIIR